MSFLLEIQLSSIDSNLIDVIWKEQPKRKFNPIISLEHNVTGKITADVLKAIRKEMTEKHCSLLAVTALDEIACKYDPCPNTFDDIHINSLSFHRCVLFFSQGF